MKSNHIQRSIRVVVLIVAVGLFFPGSLFSKTAREIDVAVDVAIERFHKQVVGAKRLIEISKGMLVMPNVIKGALIIGGEYGEGALRINGETVDYYNTISGSLGFQIGGQAKDIILLFMTDEALSQFRASSGWEAGIDGNVALITIGAGERADTTTAKEPILAFIFDAKGLIADLSLKGAKFTRLNK